MARCAASRDRALRAFTLLEISIAVALLAILAGTLVPALGHGDDRRLEVAASEVRETLRFARAEAMRRGRKVLVDAESSPGCLKLLLSNCTFFPAAVAVVDPRTKRDYVVDVRGGRDSNAVSVTPNFLAGGTAYGGLLFDETGAASDVCQVTGMNNRGAPQAGSGVALALGTKQVAVALDAATGRVTGP